MADKNVKGRLSAYKRRPFSFLFMPFCKPKDGLLQNDKKQHIQA